MTSLPPKIPSQEDDEEEAQIDDQDLSISSQYKVKPIRTSDSWIGLEVTPKGVLSTLSSGVISLHPCSSTSTQEASRAYLSSPLTCLQTIAGSDQFVAAGKEVDVAVWDMERTFAGRKDRESETSSTSKKRKKTELEEGQVWKAKNLPNNGLSLSLIHI